MIAYLEKIQRSAQILRRYPPNERSGTTKWKRPVEGIVRKGKRRGLSSLPKTWRQMMVEQCPANSAYRDALIISALTGCRPSELAKGVVIEATTEKLWITIQGAKVTPTSGQPVRQLEFSAAVPFAQVLQTITSAQAGGMVTMIDCPKAFSDFVRALSRQVFPESKYVVSPYSFRHAFAADRKAEKLPKDQIAAMMGHLSMQSQKAYGIASQGRWPLAPVQSVSASRVVNGVTETISVSGENVSVTSN